MDATSLRKISDWIIDGARSAATPSQMMAECCERLVQAGLPLWRVGVFVRTLHPEIIGWSFIWKPGEEVHVGTVDFNFRATPEFTFSPLAVVFRDGVEVRADPLRARRHDTVTKSRASCLPRKPGRHLLLLRSRSVISAVMNPSTCRFLV